ncbi:hypothetical protein ID866_9338 [Astraeus odoratus]|nr:hypothetical protein ID866_9338 [Astraeus odoratus]
MNSNTPLALPNPALYLNFLDPYIAFQYEVVRNLFIATLGAFIWDILSCVNNDWKLLRISKFQPTFFAYHLSRWGAFGFILIITLQQTRVRGAYYNNRIVCTMFIFLWVMDVALLCLLFPGMHVDEISDTKHCIGVSGGKYLVVTMLFPLFFDTMVYIFITVKLSRTGNPREKINWHTIISGAALPRLSRAILSGGQQYYL